MLCVKREKHTQEHPSPSVCVCAPSDLESVLPYDGELFGPLAKAFLAQQEGTDATVSGRRHGALIRGPLVSESDARAPLLLILLVGLVGAAQSVRVVVWESRDRDDEVKTYSLIRFIW